jgi:hypothetical protein
VDGAVNDPSGAVLPGVAVTISSGLGTFLMAAAVLVGRSEKTGILTRG